MESNPYQAPAVPPGGAEEIRQQHLKHEASLKAVGTLFLLGGLIGLVAVVGLVAPLLAAPAEIGTIGGPELGIFALVFAAVILQFVAGLKLRKLSPKGLVPAAIVAVIGLINIPVGTLISAYILYLLFSAKGRMVLSPAYHEVIAATPHIRYRTPRWIWILLIVLVVATVAIIAIGVATS